MWKAFPKTLVSICLLLLATATLFVSPGWRHAHQGGDELHSHSGSHSHTHGHSHSHSHSHSHGHVHTEDYGSGQELASNHSHIHISFLWFNLTLPDFFGAEATGSDSANPSLSGDSRPNTVRGELVQVQSPWSFSQLIQVLFLIGAPIPDRLYLNPDNATDLSVALTDAICGRLPDAPATPPPEVS